MPGVSMGCYSEAIPCKTCAHLLTKGAHDNTSLGNTSSRLENARSSVGESDAIALDTRKDWVVATQLDKLEDGRGHEWGSVRDGLQPTVKSRWTRGSACQAVNESVERARLGHRG